MAGMASSSHPGSAQISGATTEPWWVRVLLITIAFGFLALFLILPPSLSPTPGTLLS